MNLTEEKRQRLIDKVLKQLKSDISRGDVSAADELLHFVPNKNLMGFLNNEMQDEYYEEENEIDAFKKKWGQTHSEITANLNYPMSHTDSDELLMVDFFWMDSDSKWYPKCSSLYTEKEQAIADLLRKNFF